MLVYQRVVVSIDVGSLPQLVQVLFKKTVQLAEGTTFPTFHPGNAA